MRNYCGVYLNRKVKSILDFLNLEKIEKKKKTIVSALKDLKTNTQKVYLIILINH
jgi:hypothetical protein